MRERRTSLNIDRRSLSDQIYEQLREDIVYLRYEPGQMIYENEIADRLQVSRTPVREAFRLLASEQLIEIQPQRGTRISLISARKVREAWFIRELLEEGAFYEAAARWDQDIAAVYEEPLRQALKQQEDAAYAKDIQTLLRLDEDFHRLIMSISENQTLLEIIDQVRAHINRTRLLSLRKDKHLLLIVAEHTDLFNYIRTKDAKQTGIILSEHFSRFDNEIEELRKLNSEYFTD